MSEQRIGLGVDLHPFSAVTDSERELVLGGVHVPDERALSGHSDADVVAHAIADGLLGAAGLGDIGMHFPDTDERFKGANSLELLRECNRLIAKDGWHVVNADCTIITEAPRIAPIREQMIENLSSCVAAPVHVKATRPERLGALGRVEGIACLAVVLLER
jgi:2-C-methyl-D-erythritol 2,4-cyclodiphosphate synthase